jgi:hypothetical protein
MLTLEPSDEDLLELEQSLNDDMCLELLLQDAIAHKPVTKKQMKAKMLSAEESSKQVYLNPSNWNRTRGIALIHAETNTCLGNYSEFIHLKVKDCRKLLREETPIEVNGVEFVTGSWWLPAEVKPEPAQVWHQRIPAIIHLHLSELKVHAPAVPVIVCKSYGNIARCELVEETRFAQWEEEGKSGNILLYLPKGTNVYEVMSRDTKIKIKEIVG